MNTLANTLTPGMAFTHGATNAVARKSAPAKGVRQLMEFLPSNLKHALIGGAALMGLLGIGAYLVHASHHQMTDDAFTAGHVHSISTRIAGTVIDVAVDDNEHVTKGQVLVRLDPRDFQVAVDKAQADYDRTAADFQRSSSLRGSGAISQQEYDSTQAAMGVAKAALDDAKDQLSYCEIVAPADGVIGDKTVETGNRLAEGTVLMSVVQDVWVVANYKETQVAKMTPGQAVHIEVDEIPGHAFEGHIDSFSPGSGSVFALLPPENATGNFTKIVQRLPVKIVFDPQSIRGYEQRLVPGLSVETDVDVAQRSVVTPVRTTLPLASTIPGT
jgi:membrane fusion protein (multidrug efflux system)